MLDIISVIVGTVKRFMTHGSSISRTASAMSNLLRVAAAPSSRTARGLHQLMARRPGARSGATTSEASIPVVRAGVSAKMVGDDEAIVAVINKPSAL